MTTLPPVDISIVDSRDDSKIAYIIIADCKVPVLKAKIGNLCYVMKLINNTCHIELDTKGCEEKFGK